MKEESNFYHSTHSISLNDLVDIWMESFHPYGIVIVIFDAGRHFEVLKKCGVSVMLTESYNNKIVTVEVPDVLEGYELMDKIKSEGFHPYMQLYCNGRLLSDNIAPIA